MDVQLLMLEPGVTVSRHITPDSAGVRVFADRLAVSLKKQRKLVSTPSAPAADQEEEEAAAAAAKNVYAYTFHGTSLPTLAYAAAPNATELWLVGLSKLGEAFVRLMFSTERPSMKYSRSFAKRSTPAAPGQEADVAVHAARAMGEPAAAAAEEPRRSARPDDGQQPFVAMVS